MSWQIKFARRALRLKRASIHSVTAMALMTGAAVAFTPPAAGDLGFDLYDIIVNQGVLGPLGFLAAVLMLVLGVGALVRGSVMPGIFGLIAGAAVFSADQVVTTLGFVV